MMFGFDKVLDELKHFRNELKVIYGILERVEGQISELKSQRDDISLPSDIDREKQAIESLYKTKQGLFSFKKAKKAIREG